jgi:hypothetical protein
MTAQLSTGTSRINDDSRTPHDKPLNKTKAIAAETEILLLAGSLFMSMLMKQTERSGRTIEGSSPNGIQEL